MLTKTPKTKLDKSDEIALHHGFVFTKFKPIKSKRDDDLQPEEKEVIVRSAKNEIKKINEPLMFYSDEPIVLTKNQINRKNYKNLSFDIIGVQKGIAEAMIINTAVKILAEEGYKNFSIDINCIGDEDSSIKFKEELSNYYKKNINSVESSCKNTLSKKNSLFTNCEHESCKIITENAPKPINFLSDQNQKHFKEVLEYIDEMNIPYRIQSELMCDSNHYSKTVFEIVHEGEVLARGGRYDGLINKLTNKKNLSAVGISIQFKRNKIIKAYSNKIQEPEIFLIQFGFLAKLKSFEVIDILRRHKITIHQNLHKDKLTDQFEIARKMKIKKIIIIGHKEALDDEIVFKDMSEATQDNIKISKLSQYLKKIGLYK